MADKPTNPHLEKIEPNGLAIAAIGRDHFGNPIPQAWYTTAKEVIKYICPASQCLVPELDVRKIMLAVEPGPDGTGKEVYAKSVEDVRAHLAQMGQELEERRLGVKRLPASQSSKSLLKQIADLEDSLAAWRRNAELADQDNRRLEQENKELANLLASAPPAPQTSVVDDNSPSDLDYSPPGHGVDGFETPSKASVVQQEPLGFVSPKQVERIVDPDGESGAYIPMRKTPAGNFTLPLYTHPAPQQKPLLGEKKIEMWTNATIECCTHMACYMRGIEDAEAAHNIGEKK